MIWKATKRFGIGKATSREDGMFCTYIVALYAEKGNVRDEYVNNISKGDFEFGYCDSLGKEHRPSYRRFQRGKIEKSSNKTRTNTTTFSSHTDISKKKSLIINRKNLIDDKSKTSSAVSQNKNTDIESVLRPEDIVLSIKKIDISDQDRGGSIKDKNISTSITGKSDISKSKKSSKTLKNDSNSSHKLLKDRIVNFSTSKNGGKKIIVDNLMQLNDFVMKVTKRTNTHKKKSPGHNKS